ncbi:MAG TPA: TlpA disulfide reductase family protein [Candidatus Limnocylindrales bacterium]|jgi:thiol-disulfide isomerase/thioredoxin|nr:TlpA disulfide reductase family protein [Candidatus Limnocylindrales bacterium]
MTQPPGDRRARRAARRAEARRGADRTGSAPRWLLPALIGGAVVVAAVLAIALSGGGQPSGGGSSSVPPPASGGTASGSAAAIPPPTISGTPLPEFQGPASDPAVGQKAPAVTGTDFDGTPVAIADDGRPKVVLFLAHWCPHCQAEVPVVQAWVAAGGVPAGLDVISVATGTRADAPNYPPDAWLAREGWTVPVIVDPTNTVAAAYGLTAYPFWVFIGPDGTVRARTSGELSVSDLEATIRGLTQS